MFLKGGGYAQVFFIGNSTHKCFRGAWVRTSVFEIRQIRTRVSRCVQVRAFITSDESIIALVQGIGLSLLLVLN